MVVEYRSALSEEIVSNMASSGLAYTDVMFPPDEREVLRQMTQGISTEDPADIVLPIYDLGICVPFLDVKRLHSIWFASNEGL